MRDFVPKTPNFLNHLEPIVTRVLDQVRTERELAESRIVTREHEARRRELEHEIAQRKRVEQALREAEEYLRLMVESVKDFAIFTVDPQGRIVSWNPGAERLFGYPEPEILGQHLAILFTPEDRAGGVPEREIATAVAKGRASDERWHQCKDGGRFFASGVVTPIFDEENKLRGFTKIARDITERKQAEEAVREAAVRLKAIVETAVDGIITIDEQGIVESMNPAAERIFGYTHDEVVGHNIAMLMSEPERDEHSRYLRRIPADRPPKDHRHDSRGTRPPQGRLDISDGAGRQRNAPRRAPNLHRNRPRHHRIQESHRSPQRRRSAQGPVPGHARPRAAQSAGAHQQRRSDHATGRAQRAPTSAGRPR